ncbi:hypothetical protein ACFLXU_04400 [Chloroflexota bacterium]
MAKTRMMCPFLGELCKECPIYRGRHYYLCFCKKYRGHLYEPGEACEVVTSPTLGLSPKHKFEMPSINARSAIDPFAIIMKEREKGELN